MASFTETRVDDSKLRLSECRRQKYVYLSFDFRVLSNKLAPKKKIARAAAWLRLQKQGLMTQN